ncbi:hypothetical protein MPSEU_000475300 [Mayamaea pseudoterrestris]|nr:hypothetical protein MPSEU_000475300 [Mayamaea pseudoterrestris]
MRSIARRGHSQLRLVLFAILIFCIQCSSLYSYSITSSLAKTIRPGANQRRATDVPINHHIPLNKLTSLDAALSLPNGGDASMSFGEIKKFCSKYLFLVGMFVAVAMARLFPSLGTNGGVLRPELFIGKFGVMLVFFLSGLSLELSQLTRAFSNVKLNAIVQFVLFAIWPFGIGLPLTKGLSSLNFFPKPLLDGVLIMMSLPTTVNMCVILTSTAGGSIATALCNAVLSNLAGIFLTPALLFHFFGSHIQLPFLDMLFKLSNKVLLPVIVGQALRATPIKSFCDAHGNLFKRLQEFILLSILWNAFCTAFSESIGLELKHGLGLLVVLPTVHSFSLLALLAIFHKLGYKRDEVVAAAFCASQKTLAFGLPLVNTIFEGSPNLAAYCAPIMFIHPMQLIVGSLMVPRLQKYISLNGNAKNGAKTNI